MKLALDSMEPLANQSSQVNGTRDDALDTEADLANIRLIGISVYSLFILIGGPANTRVLMILLRNNLYNKTRHHKLLLNLAIADTIVCLLMLPTEVGWRLTSVWKAGDVGCRSFQFVRVFGLYASSMVLIVISLDRYYAVVQPFTYSLIGSRINRMLVTAWLVSVLLSMPQVSGATSVSLLTLSLATRQTVFFRLEDHPQLGDKFRQCVASFPSKLVEKLYTLMSIFFLYGLPLIVIIACYTVVSVRSIYQQKKAATITNKHRLDVSSGQSAVLRRENRVSRASGTSVFSLISSSLDCSRRA